MQEMNKRIEEKKYKTRTGFEGFQAQMLDGGYSDPFVALIHKLRPDGSLLTQNGKSVVQETVCRFRIAAIQHTKDTMQSTARGLSHADTGSEYNNSVDKTNRVWLDMRLANGTWSLNSILLGKAHFSSMGAVYKCEDYDSRVDEDKSTVSQKGKHILRLLADPVDKTPQIQDACRAFSACDLRYQNDVLGSVNSRGDFNPMFKRVIHTYTPIVELQTNPDCLLLLKDYAEITAKCKKWLQKNHTTWLSLETPKYKKSNTKSKHDIYKLEDHIDFMAKQTIRWGNPVFTDTENLQPVSLETIKEYLKGIVVGELGDITKQTWLELNHVLLRLYTQQLVGVEIWDSLSDSQKKDMVKRTRPTFNVKEVNHLFSPARLKLIGDIQPHSTWFRLIEQFYQAFGIGLTYSDYQEHTVKVEVEAIDEEPQKVIETVDTPLTQSYVLSGQSIPDSDPINLLSEELASTRFFDDVNDRDEIRRYIVWRRGQPEFRRKLLEAYKGRCVITGCSSEEALEAAHIEPYSKTKNNDPKNGILLRADIHTLFDCDLIGIDPDTMKVCVSPNLVDYHKDFNDKFLQLPEHLHLDIIEALRIRYKEYQERLGRYGK
jgi:hypothetical protein